MRALTFARLGTALAGAALSTLALAGAAQAATGTIVVPDDFNPAYSDTRANGHYEVQGTGLRVYTDAVPGTNKVAEYVDTSTPLAGIGEPALNLTNNSGTIPPGFQLVVDFDGDGTDDGILVGEPTFYGNDWWASNGSKQFVKDGAPSHEGGSGSDNHGTLDQWRTAFPNAVVKAFGFSLGSGVVGDWVINSIEFNGTTYTFAEPVAPVVLTSKDQCKKDGWKTSTSPVFKNQGDCVSSFASAK